MLVHGTRYALPQRLDTLAGVVRRHADGYGFVVPDDEQEDDIYLPRHAMQGVMHGDRVLVRLETRQRHGERRSGRVVQVLARGQQLSGVWRCSASTAGSCRVTPASVQTFLLHRRTACRRNAGSWPWRQLHAMP